VLDPKADIPLKSVTGTIKTTSVDTDIEARDKHLRSADFFDVEKFPEIKFECSRFRKDGDRRVVIGRFTLHGVTRSLRLPFTLKGPIKDPMGKMRVGIEARTTINRQDYGLTYNKVLETGGLAVGNEVAIEINAEAVKEEKAK
jgi:polyisoprenoid-binding protein YceI